ncbi:sugar phosphate isomerase/epimerase family protein [Halovenus salina]|uniref:Sugar phosphate isomerase/epimerase family protein n=1 Tax=Halovenus salina TaxID=1510225 RepID=A0ABD5VZ39_9EURY|nr:sugar phosphate isomerase/epimerase family protein [Halovenus salina]
MDFAFSTNAFREYDLVEAIEILGDIGYDGVEVLLDTPHLYPPEATEEDVERVREAVDDAGLEISNCNAFMLTAIEDFHHPSFIEEDPSYRQRRIDYTLDAVETTAALGADHLSIEPGGPIPEGRSRAWALDTFEDGLREVLERAEEVGVDVMVEPEPDLLIETSAQFLELADRIDSPRLRCNFDAGHFFCVGEQPADLVETLSSYTTHYHLEDIPASREHEHTQLGDGGMDIEGVLDAIAADGYDGYVTVELYPYEETAAETAREALAYLADNGWTG